MAYEMSANINEIITYYLKNHPGGNKKEIYKAYRFATQKHMNMTRLTGEPYIFHPLRVARFIARYRLEAEVIIAALLHDVVEDCDVTLEEIRDEFGEEVATLVAAVTNLDDQAIDRDDLTKEERDQIRDVYLQKNMNEKALYIKIADRIDNLSTMEGMPEEKRIKKAEHTRHIILPMVNMIHAYHLADVLEELCFQIEQPQMYKDMCEHYKRLLYYNERKCMESIQLLSKVFDPSQNNESKDLEGMHGYLVDFHYAMRSCISIYRSICQEAENIFTEWRTLFSKERIALFDMVVVVSNRFLEENELFKIHDIFFAYFEKALKQKGFYLIEYRYTTQKDSIYFLLSDEMDNLLRLFVRTELSYDRYKYGDIVDADSTFSLSDVNEVEPQDTYAEKICVFRKDGSLMNIEKGATVLDFAFHIHSDLGYHFDYALLNGFLTHHPAYTRLNEGDVVIIVKKDIRVPSVTWFRYVKTSKSVDFLVHYFLDKQN